MNLLVQFLHSLGMRKHEIREVLLEALEELEDDIKPANELDAPQRKDPFAVPR